ncbi:aldo/keto reductase [Kribbella pittospori]|uniref:aldo/keto reductase n=1 Tax=Kribbella pittospori TaxID=722689 RepID=UPI003B50D562
MAGHAEAPHRGPQPGDRGLEFPPRPARRSHRPQRDHPGGQPDRDPPVPPARRRSGADARTRRTDRVLGPFAEGRNNLFTDPVLTAIAEAHSKSVAQVVLRWLVQRDVVVIPKSVRPDRMAENLDIFDFTVTDDQLQQIASLDTGASLFFDHRDPAMATSLGSRRIE